MKLSVSLSVRDVARLDKLIREAGLKSRSAAIQYAIGLLPDIELEDAYEAAWQEWQGSDAAQLWDSTTGDGVLGAAR
ncbi:MAG: ribbon-helix-helix domain-containing protein [Candidatus Nanopelagicales bacterium]